MRQSTGHLNSGVEGLHGTEKDDTNIRVMERIQSRDSGTQQT
jgi:hypothetical protein